MYLLWIHAIAHSSMNTITIARPVAVQKCGIKYGSAWPSPPTAVITPRGNPALDGRPAARDRPVVGGGFGETHRDAGAHRGGQADQEGLPRVALKAAAKIGASVDTDPSMSPASPGCTQVSTNWRCASPSSEVRVSAGRCSRSRSCQATSWPDSVAARRFSSSRVPASVVRWGGTLTEVAGLGLHPRDLLADTRETEVLDEPHRAAAVEAGHVLAPQQRNRLAEPQAMQVHQAGAVRVFSSAIPSSERAVAGYSSRSRCEYHR